MLTPTLQVDSLLLAASFDACDIREVGFTGVSLLSLRSIYQTMIIFSMMPVIILLLNSKYSTCL